MWAARGLEYDMSAQGRTIESAVDTLVRITAAHVAYDRRHSHAPLSSFNPAPRLYWDALSRGTRLPLFIEMQWSETGALTQIVPTVVSQHPAIRGWWPVAQTA